LDNICHTLAGAAMGQAGLKRKTPLGMATLMIGANLPDVDAITYFVSDSSTTLGFRRGWTHGILAMAVWPFVLAAAMMAFDRYVRRRGKRREREPAQWKPLLLLSAIGIVSHPFLDFLNTYGVRFLMPFSSKWFYGDTLFIVDLFLWGMLGLGVFLSRRREADALPNPSRPARTALWGCGVYVLGMFLAGQQARPVVEREALEAGIVVTRKMVAPIPIDPLRKIAVVDTGTDYRSGLFAWVPYPSVEFDPRIEPKNDRDPAAVAAGQTLEGRRFLSWARFPVYRIERRANETLVHLADARYPGRRGSWARVTVRLPASSAAADAAR
jgi:inner membrane protein